MSSLHGLDVSEDEPPVPTSQYIKHMVAEEQKKARKGNTLLKYDFDSESYPVLPMEGNGIRTRTGRKWLFPRTFCPMSFDGLNIHIVVLSPT